MFSKLKQKISALTDSINGKPSSTPADTAGQQQQQPAPQYSDNRPQPQYDSQAEQASVNHNQQQRHSILDNAIDKRDRAVRLIVNALKPAAGSKSSGLANLVIWIQVDNESFDPLDYAWADDTLKEHLRHELDNALLSSVGAKSIEIRFATPDMIDKSNATTVVDELLYCTWKATQVKMPEKQHSAWLSVIPGTGSMAKPAYLLDSSIKDRYHIGRGTVSRKMNLFRRNDIVINENDPDAALHEANTRVSGMHADIVSRDGRFWVKASQGGCRSCGGSCTKLIHDEAVTEISDINTLYPLADGDMIELGKTVILLFTLSKPD